MSTAQYYDVFSEQAMQRAVPVQGLPVAIPRQNGKPVPHERQITIGLDTVMFTGRVPLSTWTFSLAIADKLWISDRTCLFFGKETAIQRAVYQDTLAIQGHRINLDVSVAAYNNYGDVLKSEQSIHFYELDSKVYPSALLHVEHDWMQLIFKFRLVAHKAQQG